MGRSIAWANDKRRRLEHFFRSRWWTRTSVAVMRVRMERISRIVLVQSNSGVEPCAFGSRWRAPSISLEAKWGKDGELCMLLGEFPINSLHAEQGKARTGLSAAQGSRQSISAGSAEFRPVWLWTCGEVRLAGFKPIVDRRPASQRSTALPWSLGICN